MGTAASITQCARSLKKRVTAYRHRQEVRKLVSWERKYRKLASLLQGPRASLAGQIKKDIPVLKKRALKSRRKLNKILPQAEKSLAYALETIDYLADLRARLVKASERIDRSPIGLNPPFDVCANVNKSFVLLMPTSRLSSSAVPYPFVAANKR